MIEQPRAAAEGGFKFNNDLSGVGWGLILETGTRKGYNLCRGGILWEAISF
jgi:hypothetical protein